MTIRIHLGKNLNNIVDKEFHQVSWDDTVAEDCRQLIRLAIREDLRTYYDWTSIALVDEKAVGKANFVAREDGIVAGLNAAGLTLHEYDPQALFKNKVSDGDAIKKGQVLADIAGSVRTLLTAERVMLNFLGRLCGIATLTSQYVAAVQHTPAKIYDTRKTTPGWRLLEKYAVHCGGGMNHRNGLYDAILIKDNHLAFGNQKRIDQSEEHSFQPADAVRHAKEFVHEMSSSNPVDKKSTLFKQEMIVEVEVDSLQQLVEVLPASPDFVLLDNMSNDQLKEAVVCRNRIAPAVQLEASGGVTLTTVGKIAETGIDRISVGALTHSATNFDIGLDWLA